MLIAVALSVGTSTAVIAGQPENPASKSRKAQVQTELDKAKAEFDKVAPGIVQKNGEAGVPQGGNSCEALRQRLEKLPPEARSAPGNNLSTCAQPTDVNNLPPDVKEALQKVKDAAGPTVEIPTNRPAETPPYANAPPDEEGVNIGTLNTRIAASVGPGPSAYVSTACNSSKAYNNPGSATSPGTVAYFSRTNACRYIYWHVDVIRNSDFAVVGQAFYQTKQWEYLRSNATDFSFHMELLQYSAWGASSAGMGMVVGLMCGPEPCVVREGETYPTRDPMLIKTGEVTSGSWYMSQPAGVDLTNYSIQVPVYIAWAPNAAATVFYDVQNLYLVRCDNMRYVTGTGCAFPLASATFWLNSAGTARESAQFIREAQGFLAGNPGWAGGTNPLHRVIVGGPEYNQNVAAKNTACAAMTKPPSDVELDCDEYPFASTAEGMRTGNAAVRYLPATANRSAGGQLSAFYAFDRVLFGDPLAVVVY